MAENLIAYFTIVKKHLDAPFDPNYNDVEKWIELNKLVEDELMNIDNYLEDDLTDLWRMMNDQNKADFLRWRENRWWGNSYNEKYPWILLESPPGKL